MMKKFAPARTVRAARFAPGSVRVRAIGTRRRSSGLALLAASLLLGGWQQQQAAAATYTYQSTGTTNWSTASWNPSAPVSSLDNVLSFTSPSGSTMVTTNNITAGFQLNRLTLTNNSSGTNPQNLSIAGSSLNFVKDSLNTLPTLVFARSTANGGRITLSAPLTVTDALTITNSAAASNQQTAITGAITNTGGITFDGSGAAFVTLGTGVISGAGGIAYNGAYTVGASGTNTYTGVTTFGAGIVSVSAIGNGGVAGNLGKATSDAANLVFNGGTLRYTGATAVTSDRAFTINSGKTATIEMSDAAGNLTLAGATGAATTGGLTKKGAGTLTLSGINTYTGATAISEGTLVVSGSLNGTASASVSSGAILATDAAGSIATAAAGNVGISGTLAPGGNSAGTAAGTLNLALGTGGKLNFATGSTLAFGLGTTSDLVAFDTAGDWLAGSGNATLQLDVTLAGFDYHNVYTVFQNAATSDFTFAAITGYDTASWTANFAQVGSDYQVSFVAVPEPGAAVSLFGGFGLLVGLQRFRRRGSSKPE